LFDWVIEQYCSTKKLVSQASLPSAAKKQLRHYLPYDQPKVIILTSCFDCDKVKKHGYIICAANQKAAE